MNVCIKCGKLPAALDIFAAMQAEGCAPNVVTFNTLIDVYGKLGQWEAALGVLRGMRAEGVAPVLRTYNTLVIACNMCSQPREALAVHAELLADQRRVLLRCALDELSPADRALLAASYDDDLSLTEIARIEGCSTGTAKVRLHRARVRLRQILEKTDV